MARAPRAATRFYFKPTALGIYLLQDTHGKLISVGGAAVTPTATPGPPAAWAALPAGRGAFALRSTDGGRWLTVARSGAVGAAVTASPRDRLRLLARKGCLAFPRGAAERGRPRAPGALSERDGV